MAGSEAGPRQQEPEGGTLPAWKREILERRRAKVTSPGGGSREHPGSPGRERAAESRHNNRGRTNSPGLRRRHDSPGHRRTNSSLRSTGRPRSPSSPQRRSGSPGRPLSSSSPRRPRSPSSPQQPLSPSSLVLPGDNVYDGESLVLQESIGPIQENLFIRQEKEKRRLQQEEARGSAARPIQHLLELCGNVPGIRTIRAENIIIIESDPDFFHDRRDSWNPRNGDISTINSLNQLLASRGRKVAEIRASEVVICEPSHNKSEEELNLFNAEDSRPQYNGVDSWSSHGMVSRLLEKFGSASKPVRSRSAENLLLDNSDLFPRGTEHKPSILPKSPAAATGKRGQASVGKTTDTSGDTAFQFHNHGRAFTPKSPDWPSSKPKFPNVISSSVTDSPTSPVSSSATMPSSLSTVSAEPLTPESSPSKGYEFRSLPVSSVRKRLESYPALGNQTEPRLKDFTRSTGGSTFTVNPRAQKGGHFRVSPSEKVPQKDNGILMNGHVVHSELDLMSTESITIQEVMSEAGKEKKEGLANGTHNESGQVPSLVSASNNEMSKRANEQRPKSKVDPVKPSYLSSGTAPLLPRNDSEALKSSATQAVTPKPGHKDGSVSATPNQQKAVSASTSPNDSFQIKLSAKPDIASIPDNDVQAKALANIRAQSRNSFVVIPKKRPVPSLPTQDDQSETEASQKPNDKDMASVTVGNETRFASLPTDGLGQSADHSFKQGSHSAVESVLHRASSAKGKSEVDSSAADPASLESKGDSFHLHPTVERQSFISEGQESKRTSKKERESPDVLVTNISAEVPRMEEALPVTNIDDIFDTDGREPNSSGLRLEESSSPPYPSHYRDSVGPSSVFQRRSGTTFIVVPKRKPPDQEPKTPVNLGGAEPEEGPMTPPGKESKAPFLNLGHLLKKRYPGVDEIEVIGGYMSLERSCLYKTGSTRKKMKISFNDSLQTTFEYPSESSLLEEGQEDEEEESGTEAEEEEEKTTLIFIPRPRYISSPTVSATLRPNTVNAGLSGYTPKHSVEFSTWQELKYEEKVANWNTTPQDPPTTLQEVMLTPADSSSLSDYSSEPALYF